MQLAMNILALPLAVLASTAVGFLWYSYALFGKQWVALMGYTKESLEKAKKTMGPKYGISMLVGLVQAFVLGLFALGFRVEGVRGHLIVAAWCWVGFVMPTQLTAWIFGGKNFKLFLIDTGYQLASLIVMAVVLGLL
jgi:hypothetical protein